MQTNEFMEPVVTPENFDEILESIRIKASDVVSIPPDVISVSGSTIATLGNFSASTGKGKSKKTFNVCAIVASVLTGKKVLNYEASFPKEKRRVVYFDTEQSDGHCHKVMERINLLSGYPRNYDSELLEFYYLRKFGPLNRRRIIELYLAKVPDIGLVIIDGLRDLLYDINSSAESSEVIGLLMRWSGEYNLHIHTVLHLNKGDDNVRGHIGTELNHKAETILQVVKNDVDGSISEVHAALIRERDFPPFAFRINDDGIPELVDEDDYESTPQKKPVFNYEYMAEELHRKALSVAFGENREPILYTPLLGRLEVGYATIGIERRRNVMINLLKFLLKNEIIRKEGKGYLLNEDFHFVPQVPE